MIDIKGTIGTALTTDATLTALLGSGERVFYITPPVNKVCPCIIYSEEDNKPVYCGDNEEIASEIIVYVNVFTAGDTFPIASRTNDLMVGLGFVREYARDLPKNNGMYQKHMRFQTMKEV